MISSNSKLRALALGSLRGKWSGAIVVTLVYYLICSTFYGSISISWMPWSVKGFGFLVMIFLGLPLMYGYFVTMLNVARNNEMATLESLFSGFKNYSSVIGTMLLMAVYTFLWSLLLVIPGIIKGYSYMMTPYILADDPQIGSESAINESMRMMRGKKMKLFLLDLSFIGWVILCILTLGIGTFWLEPYIYTARAHFYLELKEATQPHYS